MSIPEMCGNAALITLTTLFVVASFIGITIGLRLWLQAMKIIR